MRSARVLLVTLCAAGTLLVVALALTRDTTLAFTLGVTSVAPVVKVEPGQTACQRPISVPAGGGFDRIAFMLGTYRRTGPPVDVTVRDAGGRIVASGRVAGGYPDITEVPRHTVSIGHVGGGDGLAVCLTNAGDHSVAIYGNTDGASRTSSAYLGSRPLNVDLNFVFERQPRSLATLLPRIIDRASLFRPPLTGPWVYVLMSVLVVCVVPALLLAALRDSTEE
jgi:hypothetical protein